MAYTLVRYGSLPITILNGTQRPRGGGRKPSSIEMPYGTYDPHGTEQIRPGARTVSITGAILGTPAERQATLDAWYAAGGTRNKLWSYSSSDQVTNTMQWAWARLHFPDPERHYKRPSHDELSLEWTIYSTFWHGLHHGNGLDLDTGETFDAGLVLDFAGSIYDTLFALTMSPQNVTLVNAGNAPVVETVITVHAGDSAITNTLISLSGSSMAYTGTIAAGKNLVIDVGQQTVRNSGILIDNGADYANFTEPSTQIDWLRLESGSNNLTVTTTGGGTGKTILFEYDDSWHG